MRLLIEYVGLFVAAVAFEFAYVGWARSASKDAVWATVGYSVVTAALGLVGIGGALKLPAGWIPYLAGIGLGAWSSAYLGKRQLVSTVT